MNFYILCMEIRKLNHYSHCYKRRSLLFVDSSTKAISMDSVQILFWTHSSPQGWSCRSTMTGDEHSTRYFLLWSSEASTTISWQSLYSASSLLCCSSLIFSLVFRVYQKELNICCGMDDNISHNLTYLNSSSPIVVLIGELWKFFGSMLLWAGFETLYLNLTSCCLFLIPVFYWKMISKLSDPVTSCHAVLIMMDTPSGIVNLNKLFYMLLMVMELHHSN